MVEVFESLFADVRDITSDFLRPQFGIAGGDIKFGDVDRSVDVLFGDFFRDHDSIFEVVTVPRHERYENVATNGEFAFVGVRAVCKHIAFFDLLTTANNRLLVDAGAGVRAHKLAQWIGHDAFFHVSLHAFSIGKELLISNRKFTIQGGDNDFCRCSSHDTIELSNHHSARVACSFRLKTSSYERSLRNEKRHTLALHVRAHQRAVGVVVLKERNQTSGNGNQLFRRNVHVLDIVWSDLDELTAFFTSGDALILELTGLVNRVVRLSDVEFLFLVSREILDLVGDFAIFHLTIRCFDETELIDTSVGAH